jgi:hypothetical protein
MRDYGKVYSTFWSSQTTGSMSDDAKLLALYLMSCPHSTIAGVFRLPDGYVSEDLGWPLERVAKGFAELFDNGFANRCETTKWVWIRKHLEWNKPENPNQRKSAAKIALSIPIECGWKREFMRVCGEVLALPSVDEPNPSETLPKGFRNQEQEQEQEQEEGSADLLVEVAADVPPPVAVALIPLNDGTEFSVTEAMVAEWDQAFPAVDVPQKLREIRAWCLANPGRRKTRRGVAAFINRWLGKEQDSGRGAFARPLAAQQDSALGSFV